MVWFGLVWFGLVWFGLVWFVFVWFGLVWFGLVWFGLVQFGLVWFGVVWFGLVWFGLVWFGRVGFGVVFGVVFGFGWLGSVVWLLFFLLGFSLLWQIAGDVDAFVELETLSKVERVWQPRSLKGAHLTSWPPGSLERWAVHVSEQKALPGRIEVRA